MAETKTLEKYSALELSSVCVGVDAWNHVSDNRETNHGYNSFVFDDHADAGYRTVSRFFNCEEKQIKENHGTTGS